MSLSAQFAGYFDRSIQNRGADYFRTGRVRIDSTSAARIVAVVKGSSRYEVELEREGRMIDASCTSPYYDVDFCKHIWAVMLAAEEQPLLQGKGLELVHIGDDGFDGEALSKTEALSKPEAPGKHEALSEPTAPGKPKTPNWRKQMAGVLAKPPSADSPSSDPWPPRSVRLDWPASRAGCTTSPRPGKGGAMRPRWVHRRHHPSDRRPPSFQNH